MGLLKMRFGLVPSLSENRQVSLSFEFTDALERTLSVVERREVDSMPCGKRLDFRDSFRRDKPSPLREGLETAGQGEGHALE
jgi:hypothetical protein